MAKISVDSIDDNDSNVTDKAASTSKTRKLSKTSLLVGLFVIVLVALCGYMVVDRTRLSDKVDKLSETQQKQTPAEDEAKQLASDVSSLIDLPADETPTVATVTDVTKVKDKPFFAKAQNGDKVLLYAKSSKAILYRPATKKLIEVSTLNLSEAQPTSANTSTTGTTR